jgi:hypothetical protein
MNLVSDEHSEQLFPRADVVHQQHSSIAQTLTRSHVERRVDQKPASVTVPNQRSPDRPPQPTGTVWRKAQGGSQRLSRHVHTDRPHD